jgi:hypothetical protein
MAKVLDAPPATDLYEEDFYLWTQQQAELLRAGRFGDVDLANLIEEIESLGRSDRREVLSRTNQILLHFLKLQYSPARDPRHDWRDSIIHQRGELGTVLTATLRPILEAELLRVYGIARRRATEQLARDGVKPDILPRACPYTLEQILDPDWWPASEHGIDDHPPTMAE